MLFLTGIKIGTELFLTFKISFKISASWRAHWQEYTWLPILSVIQWGKEGCEMLINAIFLMSTRSKSCARKPFLIPLMSGETNSAPSGSGWHHTLSTAALRVTGLHADFFRGHLLQCEILLRSTEWDTACLLTLFYKYNINPPAKPSTKRTETSQLESGCFIIARRKQWKEFFESL